MQKRKYLAPPLFAPQIIKPAVSHYTDCYPNPYCKEWLPKMISLANVSAAASQKIHKRLNIKTKENR
jgi:hypothetical protein